MTIEKSMVRKDKNTGKHIAVNPLIETQFSYGEVSIARKGDIDKTLDTYKELYSLSGLRDVLHVEGRELLDCAPGAAALDDARTLKRLANMGGETDPRIWPITSELEFQYAMQVAMMSLEELSYELEVYSAYDQPDYEFLYKKEHKETLEATKYDLSEFAALLSKKKNLYFYCKKIRNDILSYQLKIREIGSNPDLPYTYFTQTKIILDAKVCCKALLRELFLRMSPEGKRNELIEEIETRYKKSRVKVFKSTAALIIVGDNRTGARKTYRESYRDWFKALHGDAMRISIGRFIQTWDFINSILRDTKPESEAANVHVYSFFKGTRNQAQKQTISKAIALLHEDANRLVLFPTLGHGLAVDHAGRGTNDVINFYFTYRFLLKAAAEASEYLPSYLYGDFIKKRPQTYGVNITTDMIAQAAILHPATDVINGAHIDNMSDFIFYGFDRFWQGVEQEQTDENKVKPYDRSKHEGSKGEERIDTDTIDENETEEMLELDSDLIAESKDREEEAETTDHSLDIQTSELSSQTSSTVQEILEKIGTAQLLAKDDIITEEALNAYGQAQGLEVPEDEPTDVEEDQKGYSKTQTLSADERPKATPKKEKGKQNKFGKRKVTEVDVAHWLFKWYKRHVFHVIKKSHGLSIDRSKKPKWHRDRSFQEPGLRIIMSVPRKSGDVVGETKDAVTIRKIGETGKSQCFKITGFPKDEVIFFKTSEITTIDEYWEALNQEIWLGNEIEKAGEKVAYPDIRLLLREIGIDFPHAAALSEFDKQTIELHKDLFTLYGKFIFCMSFLEPVFFLDEVKRKIHNKETVFAEVVREITDYMAVLKSPFGIEMDDTLIDLQRFIQYYEQSSTSSEQKKMRRVEIISQFERELIAYVAQIVLGIKAEEKAWHADDEIKLFLTDLVLQEERKYLKVTIEFIISIVNRLIRIANNLQHHGISNRDFKPQNLCLQLKSVNKGFTARNIEHICIIDVETGVKLSHIERASPIPKATAYHANITQLRKFDLLQKIYPGSLFGKVILAQDQFALVATIYEMITGDYLFKQGARIIQSVILKKMNYFDAFETFWESTNEDIIKARDLYKHRLQKIPITECFRFGDYRSADMEDESGNAEKVTASQFINDLYKSVRALCKDSDGVSERMKKLSDDIKNEAKKKKALAANLKGKNDA